MNSNPDMASVLDRIQNGPPERSIQPQNQSTNNALSNEPALFGDGSIVYKRFVMEKTDLIIPDNVTEQEWGEFGHFLGDMDNAISWVIGAWAEYGNKVLKRSYENLAQEFGYEVSTLKTYASVYRNVPRLIRNQPLLFAHYRLVAPLRKYPEQQAMWIRAAAENDWTPDQLAEQMHPKKERAKESGSLRKIHQQARALADAFMQIPEVNDEQRRNLAKLFRQLAAKIERQTDGN